MSSLRNSYAITALPPSRPVARRFTVDGTELGSADLAQDFASAPVEYWAAPPPNEIWDLQHINFIISDNGSPPSDGYGSIGSGTVTNGVLFFVERNGLSQNLTDVSFITNLDYLQYSNTYDFFEFGGGQRALKYREFLNAYAKGVVISGATNDRVGVIVNDDFSSLTTHSCTAKLAGILNIV